MPYHRNACRGRSLVSINVIGPLWALVVVACGDRTVTAPVSEAKPSQTERVSLSRSADGRLYLAGPNVVHVPAMPGFVERSRVFVRGERLGMNGCRVTTERRLAKGTREVEMIAEADFSTCAFMVVRGSAPRRAFPESAGQVRSALASATSSIASTPRGLRSLMAESPSERSVSLSRIRRNDAVYCGLPAVDIGLGRQRIYWHDPIFIPVASDEMYMRWNYNWYCAYFLEGYHQMNWFTASGWSLIDWYTYPVLSDFYYRWVEAKGYSYFRNPGGDLGFPLCTSEVWANVRRNSVIGNADGTVTFSQTSDLSGPSCTLLLFHVVERENY